MSAEKIESATGTPKKSKISPLKRQEHWAAMAFVSIKYVGLLLFTLLPLVVSFLYSMTDYIAMAETEPFFTRIDDLWCNFDNYARLFQGENLKYFMNAVKNNCILILSVPLGIAFGLVVAVILSREGKIHGSRIIRMLIYIPVVSSAVAMNVIWRYIFDHKYGIVNQFFGMQIEWLRDETWIKVAMIIKTAWGSIGRTMILCLAALTGVGNDYYEAADLDGAGEITKFFKIALPLISPTIFYLVTTGLINNLQAFVDSQIFAGGAFGGQTIVYFIWSFGIHQSEYGLASAASFILTIAIMIITFVQFKLQDKWVYSD